MHRNPDVIIAFSTNLALDFKATTATIPIVGVFALPVEKGIVPSVARPGDNITGSLWMLGLITGLSGSNVAASGAAGDEIGGH
jgi:hypothetical protein